MVEIHPLGSIGEVEAGADLAAVLGDALQEAGLAPEANDILVVTQKIVSKAENRFVDLATVAPCARAIELAAVTRKDPRIVELVLQESSEILRAVPHVLIARHRTGCVMANAGIDRSNLGREGDYVLLLPVDPDASADRLRSAMADRWPMPPAVLISDSFGRPWRYGVVNVAIGASGLPSLIDQRGQPDRDGRTLEVTQFAFADAVATAAGLVTGEGAESIPAVLVRGLSWGGVPAPATALVRPLSEDLFR